MKRRRLAHGLGVVFALALAAAALAVAPAAADPLPEPTAFTLTGETLRSVTGSVSSLCPSSRSGTVNFKVTGVAIGKYPGTFSEFGSLTFSGGIVTGFKAVFTIESAAGTVQGTKVFLRPRVPVPVLCVGPTFAATNVPLRYTAEIITPLGIFRDTGMSFASLAATDTKTVSLTETFVSSLETAELILDPPGLSPPVLPGHGCGDENHVHEDVLLCALPDAIDEEPSP